MAGEADPKGGNPPAPAPAPGVPPAPAPAPEGEEKITLTTTQLNERMERARRGLLKKEFGVDDPEALQAKLKRLTDLEKTEEDRKKAQMSAEEKLQADLATERGKREAAEKAAEAAKVDAHLTRLFASNGIKNVDYATFKVMNKLGSLPETEELDENAYLAELLKDPRERIALGLDVTPAPPADPTKVTVPPTTTVAPGTAPTPPGANPAVPPKSAFDLDQQAWAKRKADLGIQ